MCVVRTVTDLSKQTQGVSLTSSGPRRETQARMTPNRNDKRRISSNLVIFLPLRTALLQPSKTPYLCTRPSQKKCAPTLYGHFGGITVLLLIEGIALTQSAIVRVWSAGQCQDIPVVIFVVIDHVIACS